jgi:hypothetical protein
MASRGPGTAEAETWLLSGAILDFFGGWPAGTLRPQG